MKRTVGGITRREIDALTEVWNLPFQAVAPDEPDAPPVVLPVPLHPDAVTFLNAAAARAGVLPVELAQRWIAYRLCKWTKRWQRRDAAEALRLLQRYF